MNSHIFINDIKPSVTKAYEAFQEATNKAHEVFKSYIEVEKSALKVSDKLKAYEKDVLTSADYAAEEAERYKLYGVRSLRSKEAEGYFKLIEESAEVSDEIARLLKLLESFNKSVQEAANEVASLSINATNLYKLATHVGGEAIEES